MKVCIKTHTVASFGEIPEGSLWDDESPYVVDDDCFAEVGTEPPAKPVRKPKEA